MVEKIPNKTKGVIGKLEVDEICYLPEPYSLRLYNRVCQIQHRTGRVFEFQECKNGGIVIRRAS